MRTSKKHNTQHEKTKMIKRTKIAMKLLDEVKAEFLETAEFIDDRPEQECSKKNISVEEVIFLFTCLGAKS